jgi:pimeloyl-CoA synthetase
MYFYSSYRRNAYSWKPQFLDIFTLRRLKKHLEETVSNHQNIRQLEAFAYKCVSFCKVYRELCVKDDLSIHYLLRYAALKQLKRR